MNSAMPADESVEEAIVSGEDCSLENRRKLKKEQRAEVKKKESKSSKTQKPTNPKTLSKNLRKSTNKNTKDADNEDLILQLSLFKKLDKNLYSCDLCSVNDDKLFAKSKSQIVKHLLQTHTNCQPHECSYCSSTFRQNSFLQAHMEINHPAAKNEKAKFFECVKCQHRSIDENLLNLHTLRKHAAMYKYVCKCCAKCFKNWRAFYEHESLMERKKPLAKSKKSFICDVCERSSSSKAQLVKHLKQAHSFKENVATVSFNCKVCPKVFMTVKALRSHLLAHIKNGAEPNEVETELTGFTCKECGKRISSKDHLKTHRLVHTGERPYSCPDCGQAFALRNTMRVHALSHHGIKPYVCYICNLNYSQRSALMVHWKAKHKSLPTPPPIEIHQFFDEEGRVLAPY